MIGVVALGSPSQQGDRRPEGGYQLPYDALENKEMATKAMTDTALHKMADEPPSRLQCCHGRHSSTMSCPAATWLEDHDDSHDRTCTRRRHSLQAKFARTSLRHSTLRSGEPPALYTPWPRTLYKGSQGTHLRGHAHPLPFYSFTIVVGLLELHFGQPSA